MSYILENGYDWFLLTNCGGCVMLHLFLPELKRKAGIGASSTGHGVAPQKSSPLAPGRCFGTDPLHILRSKRIRRLVFGVGALFGLALMSISSIACQSAAVGASSSGLSQQNKESKKITPYTLTVGHLVSASLKTAMLAGKGATVRELMDNIHANVDNVKVRIFSPRGDYAYAPKVAAPAVDLLPSTLRKVMLNPERNLEPGGLVTLPLLNERRCQRCHEEGPVRGFLEMKQSKSGLGDEQLFTRRVGDMLQVAVMYLMTTGHAALIDDFLQEVSTETDSLESTLLIASNGEAIFGDPFFEVPAEVLGRLVSLDEPFVREQERIEYLAYPLRNEPRCHNCHSPKVPLKGGIIAAFAKERPALSGKILESTLNISLRYIMLSGLGRILKSFLNDVSALGLVDELKVYDPAGRIFHDVNAIENPPAHVARALESGKSDWVVPANGDGEVILSLVLENEAKCQQCHGMGNELRGIIEVTTFPSKTGPSPGPAHESLSNSLQRVLNKLVVRNDGAQGMGSVSAK